MEIEMPVLLAYVIEDSTDIFRISGGGFEHPNPPSRYATGWLLLSRLMNSEMKYVDNCDLGKSAGWIRRIVPWHDSVPSKCVDADIIWWYLCDQHDVMYPYFVSNNYYTKKGDHKELQKNDVHEW